MFKLLYEISWGKISLSGLSIPFGLKIRHICKTCKFLSQCVVCKTEGDSKLQGKSFKLEVHGGEEI